MSPRLSEETGLVLGGRYRLIAPVGIGTSSRVYLAIDNQLRRQVAVKLLHESLAEDNAFLKRFRAEARAAGALSHQNIVSVFDWGEDDSSGVLIPYLVTEYLGGGSLQGILNGGVPLTPSQTLMVGLEAARALAHAHQRGLVHRDVKPGNLLFDDDGRLRLADFGLARALAEASWTEPSGAVVGTARYISPEQALGRRVDGHSDVYSLTLVLVECLSGKVPFVADTTAGTLALRTQGDLVLDSSLGSLRSVLEHAGRLNPEDRPDAATFELALLAAAEEMPRPEPLPIVPTLGKGEETSEMFIAREIEILGDAPAASQGAGSASSNAGAAGAGSSVAAAGSEAGAPTVLPHPDPVVISRPAPPASDAQPKFAEAIGADTETQMLAASLPQALGPVEPLVATDRDGNKAKRRRLSGPLAKLSILIVVLALAAGGFAGWWFLVRIPTHDVPTLTGKTVAEATKSAEGLGFKVDSTTQDRKDGTRPGQVLEQTPAAGTELAEGEKVSLTVSLGPTLTGVPPVAGTSSDQAVAALTGAGLVVGARTEAHDEKVPKGSVISVAPSAGQEPLTAQNQLPKGSSVDLVISQGPAPRTVPDGLVGASAEKARAALEAVQLKADITKAFDEKVPAGVIVSSQVAAGTQVERGTTVALVVSQGPAPIPVPDVRWVSGLVATQRLEEAGFTVAGIEGPPSGMVLQTDPTPGEKLQRGTAVRIFTKK